MKKRQKNLGRLDKIMGDELFEFSKYHRESNPYMRNSLGNYKRYNPLQKTKYAWFKNFKRKEKRGKFNARKAHYGLTKYYVPEIYKKYIKEHSGHDASIRDLSPKTRNYLGGKILRQYRYLRKKRKKTKRGF